MRHFLVSRRHKIKIIEQRLDTNTSNLSVERLDFLIRKVEEAAAEAADETPADEDKADDAK